MAEPTYNPAEQFRRSMERFAPPPKPAVRRSGSAGWSGPAAYATGGGGGGGWRERLAGPLSALGYVFDVVDVPRAFVFSAINEVAQLSNNPAGGGMLLGQSDDDASFKDLFEQTFDKKKRIYGRDWIEGSPEHGIVKSPLADHMPDWAVAATGFGVDLAFDPLTYVGGAGVAKAGAKVTATRVAEAAADDIARTAERAAARKLGEQAVGDVGEQAAKQVAESAAQGAAKGGLERTLANQAAKQADDAAKLRAEIAKTLAEGGDLKQGKMIRLVADDPEVAKAIEAGQQAVAKARRTKLSELTAEEMARYLPNEQRGLQFAGLGVIPGTGSKAGQAFGELYAKGSAKAADLVSHTVGRAFGTNVALRDLARSGKPEEAWGAVWKQIGADRARAEARTLSTKWWNDAHHALKGFSDDEMDSLPKALEGDQAAVKALGGDRVAPVRKLLDEIAAHEKATGANINIIEDYIPRRLHGDPKVRDALRKLGLLAKKGGNANPLAIHERARSLVADSQGFYHFGGESFKAANNAEVTAKVTEIARRMLEQVDPELAKNFDGFFNTDMRETLAHYIKQAANRSSERIAATELFNKGLLGEVSRVRKLTPAAAKESRTVGNQLVRQVQNTVGLRAVLDDLDGEIRRLAEGLVRGRQSQLRLSAAGKPLGAAKTDSELLSSLRTVSNRLGGALRSAKSALDDAVGQDVARAADRAGRVARLEKRISRLQRQIAYIRKLPAEKQVARLEAVQRELKMVVDHIPEPHLVDEAARLSAESVARRESTLRLAEGIAAWREGGEFPVEDLAKTLGVHVDDAQKVAEKVGVLAGKNPKAAEDAVRTLVKRANEGEQRTVEALGRQMSAEVRAAPSVSEGLAGLEGRLDGLRGQRAKYGKNVGTPVDSAVTRAARADVAAAASQSQAAAELVRDTGRAVADRVAAAKDELGLLNRWMRSGVPLDDDVRRSMDAMVAELEDAVRWGKVTQKAADDADDVLRQIGAYETTAALTRKAIIDGEKGSNDLISRLAKLSTQQHDVLTREMRNGMFTEMRYGIGSPNDFAEMIRAAEKLSIPKFLTHVQAATGWVAAWQIANPGFHERNFYGIIFNNMLAGINPRSYREFMRVHKLVREGREAEVAAHLLERYRKVEAIVGRGQTSVGELGQKIGGKLGRRSKNPLSRNGPIIGLSQDVGARLEHFGRGSLAWDKMAKGAGQNEALQWVARFHFDYQDLNKFEQIVRSVAPFYVFTRNNLPLQLEMIAKNPKVYNRVGLAVNNINWMSEENPDAVVPRYFSRLAPMARMPWTRNGGHDYATMDLPMADVERFVPGGSLNVEDPLMQAASMVSPVFKTPIELWSDKQFFKDQPLSDTKYVHVPLPPGVRDVVGPVLTKLGVAEEQDGQFLMTEKDSYALTQWLPMLHQYNRLFPQDKGGREKRLASWASWLFGVGLRSNSLEQQERTVRGEHYGQKAEWEKEKQRRKNRRKAISGG